MFPFLSKAKNIALDILFPPICLNCQKPITDRNKLICEKCLNLIKFNNTLFCPVCRARLPENERICHFNSQYLLAAAGNYDDPVLQNLIHSFKYKYLAGLSPILGEIILNYLNQLSIFIKAERMSSQRDSEAERAWCPSEARTSEAEGPAKSLAGRLSGSENLSAWLVAPIPLHPKKERQRGFNQSKLIAEFLTDKLNLEFCDALKRIKNTEPQAKIKDPEKRMKNINGCFEIKNPEKIQGKNILLVDDVFTSGSTISEAVKILKINGASKIIAVVLAKA